MGRGGGSIKDTTSLASPFSELIKKQDAPLHQVILAKEQTFTVLVLFSFQNLMMFLHRNGHVDLHYDDADKFRHLDRRAEIYMDESEARLTAIIWI